MRLSKLMQLIHDMCITLNAHVIMRACNMYTFTATSAQLLPVNTWRHDMAMYGVARAGATTTRSPRAYSVAPNDLMRNMPQCLCQSVVRAADQGKHKKIAINCMDS